MVIFNIYVKDIICIYKIRKQCDLHTTHVLRHMMYGYTLLVPMNLTVVNKLCKERNISSHGHKQFMTCKVLKSRKQCTLPIITTTGLGQLKHNDVKLMSNDETLYIDGTSEPIE